MLLVSFLFETQPPAHAVCSFPARSLGTIWVLSMPVNPSDIRNKIKRSQVFHRQQQHRQKQEKQQRLERKKQEHQDPSLRQVYKYLYIFIHFL